MKLEKIRGKLDKIDAKFVRLLSERQAYMPLVGKYKKENNIPFHQPKREKEILEYKKEMAKELSVSSELVEKIFLLIFKNSKDIQKESK